jgi:hypothetical protein
MERHGRRGEQRVLRLVDLRHLDSSHSIGLSNIRKKCFVMNIDVG